MLGKPNFQLRPVASATLQNSRNRFTGSWIIA